MESDIGAAVLSNIGTDHSRSSEIFQMQKEGRLWSDVRADLLARKMADYDWRSGRVPLYVYHDDDELLAVSREAYNLFFSENALGGRAFPSLVRMEEEIIRMSLS